MDSAPETRYPQLARLVEFLESDAGERLRRELSSNGITPAQVLEQFPNDLIEYLAALSETYLGMLRRHAQASDIDVLDRLSALLREDRFLASPVLAEALERHFVLNEKPTSQSGISCVEMWEGSPPHMRPRIQVRVSKDKEVLFCETVSPQAAAATAVALLASISSQLANGIALFKEHKAVVEAADLKELRAILAFARTHLETIGSSMSEYSGIDRG